MSLRALYSAATGMKAQETRIGNIANNLSNLNTTGYKVSRENFEDLMYDQLQTPGTKTAANTIAPVGIQIGHGSKLVGVYKEFSQGELAQTSRELDVAIEGNGMFPVTLDDGTTGYTRDGSFKLNANGNIVTTSGFVVQPNITVPQETKSLSIGADGTINAVIPGEATPRELGRLQLALFQNNSGLKAIGHNLFQETAASGSATLTNANESGAGSLTQGFVENSNVNVSNELVDMIVAQRTYEANSRVLSTTSDMMKTAASTAG